MCHKGMDSASTSCRIDRECRCHCAGFQLTSASDTFEQTTHNRGSSVKREALASEGFPHHNDSAIDHWNDADRLSFFPQTQTNGVHS